MRLLMSLVALHAHVEQNSNDPQNAEAVLTRELVKSGSESIAAACNMITQFFCHDDSQDLKAKIIGQVSRLCTAGFKILRNAVRGVELQEEVLSGSLSLGL